jgi:hypothetical protein
MAVSRREVFSPRGRSPCPFGGKRNQRGLLFWHPLSGLISTNNWLKGQLPTDITVNLI